MGELERVRSALIDALVQGAADTLDLPHVVVTEAGCDVQVCGPYPDALAALVAAERYLGEDPTMVCRVVALGAPRCED